MKINENMNCLILEDEAPINEHLSYLLEELGFRIFSYTTVEDASLALENGLPEISVAILDNELKEKDGQIKKGLDFGKELRRKFGYRAPFFLVYTAHERPEFLHGAIELSVIKYLMKKRNPEQVVPYAVTLSALWNAKNGPVETNVANDQFQSEKEALLSWCRNTLLSYLPSQLSQVEFKVLSANAPLEEGPATVILWQQNGDFRLELKYLGQSGDSDALKMMSIIGEHAFLTLHGVMNSISRNWLEHRIRKEEFLEATQYFCGMIGQELESCLRNMPINYFSDEGRRINKLSYSLKNSGEQLQKILDKRKERHSPPPVSNFFSDLPKVTKNMQKRYDLSPDVFSILPCPVGEDVKLPLGAGDFNTVFSEFFGWMIILAKSQDLPNLRIFINVDSDHRGHRIVLEDNNERLPDYFREKVLFKPFLDSNDDATNNLGLYLPVTLLEQAGAMVKDCSDHMKKHLGHRFVITFPIQVDDAVL